MRSLFVCALALAGVSWCLGQSGNPVLVGAGNVSPFPMPVAPGQLLTLFVQPATPLSPITTSAVSAVYSLAGKDEAMPVLRLDQTDTACNYPILMSPCPQVLAVTVQIPFDIPVVCPLCARPLTAYGAIAVSVGGVKSPAVGVNPLQDQVHFVTQCDVIIAGPGTITFGGLPCTPFVTHADGRSVSSILPAQAGEELVAYATGLGATNPPLKLGQPAAQSSPTVTTFAIDFNYRVNALATQPGTVGVPVQAETLTPLYTGATKGYIGLYQINFIVPPAPAVLTPCVNNATLPPFPNAVRSNLTVSVGSNFSFDGAGICVLPPGTAEPLSGS